MSDTNEEKQTEEVAEVAEVKGDTAEATDVAEEKTDPKINYDDFAKVEMTVGEIKSAEKVENADRLLRLEVDFGDHQRQIVSGIADYYENPEDLVGTKCPFVTNLAPRVIRGLESNGMILAAIDRVENNFSLPKIDDSIPAGTKLG
jgi:methionyl-tRNA synthetase